MSRLPTDYEIEVRYEPVVDGATGEIRGVHASLHGTFGGTPLHPDTLADSLRAHGFDLVGFTFERVADDLVRWSTGGGTRVWASVAVDAEDMVSADVVDIVASQFPGPFASRLIVELTERQQLDLEAAEVPAGRLRELGVRLAIDDFGIGNATIGRFERLHPSVLKIDRSFVRGVGSAGPRRAMVHVCMALARTADVTVVADGVERIDQLRVLRALGCDLFQGPLFSPAVSAWDVAGLIGATRVIQLDSPDHRHVGPVAARSI